jgi:hypothetical protein
MRAPRFNGGLACYLVEGSLYLIAVTVGSLIRLFKHNA